MLDRLVKLDSIEIGRKGELVELRVKADDVWIVVELTDEQAEAAAALLDEVARAL
jgi:methyl coenzyme M reductase subunit D